MIDPLYILPVCYLNPENYFCTLQKAILLNVCYASRKRGKKKINFRTLQEATARSNPSFWRNEVGAGVATTWALQLAAPALQH